MVKSMMNGARWSVAVPSCCWCQICYLCSSENLGVMIIDEEHEAAYKQDSNPVTMPER